MLFRSVSQSRYLLFVCSIFNSIGFFDASPASFVACAIFSAVSASVAGLTLRIFAQLCADAGFMILTDIRCVSGKDKGGFLRPIITCGWELLTKMAQIYTQRRVWVMVATGQVQHILSV